MIPCKDRLAIPFVISFAFGAGSAAADAEDLAFSKDGNDHVRAADTANSRIQVLKPVNRMQSAATVGGAMR